MKARLGRYALWQARDFVFDRALAILFTGAAIVFINRVLFAAGSVAASARGGTDALRFGGLVMKGVLDLTWAIVPLLAVRGISSDDRKEGRYRLLFAKPVSVPRFYAQAFLVNGALSMICAALLVAGTRLIVPLAARTAGDAMLIFATSYLLVGGLLFLFSAIFRWDWVAVAVLVSGAVYLAAKFPDARWLHLFPPVWRILLQFGSLPKLAAVDSRSLALAAAYGVACFLLGLLVLRRRPLAT